MHGGWVVDSGIGKLLFFVYHNTCIDIRLYRTEKCVAGGNITEWHVVVDVDVDVDV